MRFFWQKERPMLKVGDTAPDFEVPDHTGAVRRLADFRGKNVVLWFYPAAETPG
jgi:peroxiredoxin Q/BCP